MTSKSFLRTSSKHNLFYLSCFPFFFCETSICLFQAQQDFTTSSFPAHLELRINTMSLRCCFVLARKFLHESHLWNRPFISFKNWKQFGHQWFNVTLIVSWLFFFFKFHIFLWSWSWSPNAIQQCNGHLYRSYTLGLLLLYIWWGQNGWRGRKTTGRIVHQKALHLNWTRTPLDPQKSQQQEIFGFAGVPTLNFK